MKVALASRGYLGVVLDAWSRRVVGWSVYAELVVGLHRRSQYTSWAFGTRLRAAGLLGSMGSIGDAYDNHRRRLRQQHGRPAIVSWMASSAEMMSTLPARHPLGYGAVGHRSTAGDPSGDVERRPGLELAGLALEEGDQFNVTGDPPLPQPPTTRRPVATSSNHIHCGDGPHLVARRPASRPVGRRSIGDADNSMAESFFHTLQLELLDEWTSRRDLALPSIQMLSPIDSMITTTNPSAGIGAPQPWPSAFAGRRGW